MSNDEQPIIRRYRESDEAACRACIVELQDAERQFDARLRPGEEIADAYLLQMHARCRECAGTILVAEADGLVAGLAMILTRVEFETLDEPPGSYALVAEFVVRPSVRRRGIGGALLREAERYALEAGARELRIKVLSANRIARHLYERHGFSPYLETLSKALGM